MSMIIIWLVTVFLGGFCSDFYMILTQCPTENTEGAYGD